MVEQERTTDEVIIEPRWAGLKRSPSGIPNIREMGRLPEWIGDWPAFPVDTAHGVSATATPVKEGLSSSRRWDSIMPATRLMLEFEGADPATANILCGELHDALRYRVPEVELCRLKPDPRTQDFISEFLTGRSRSD